MENKITIRDLEDKLWKAADTLRGNLSAEDYMHVVLGILTLKFINDKNELAIQELINDGLTIDTIEKSDLNAKDSFVVPEESKWVNILKKVGTPEIGFALDEAIYKLGEENPELRGIFSASYNDNSIDKIKLGEVVKIFQSDNLGLHGEDILGRIYEYFLGNFFLKRGQKGGEFYTPRSIVRLITLFIKPIKGKIYDPCCGTAGMLVQAKQFIDEKKINTNNITVYGQEYNNTTWKLAKLNLLLNGLNIFNTNEIGDEIAALGQMAADTFTNDQHKGEVFDFIMANPPFNLKEYWNNSLKGDPRWIYGEPPQKNANFAWL
ncbi:MAG: SAM-dependent DNA methyltransferase, partial [Mycoplasmataceae bacterium]|nr:SAM-dependent DNA methyltransferase [Mycoplasmataceae bacterium]